MKFQTHKLNITPLAIILIIGSFLLLNSCATPQKTETEVYMQTLTSKIEPTWKAEIKDRVKNLNKHGLTPVTLASPDNEILIGFFITKDGSVEDIQTLKKSKYAFLNKAAIKILEKSSPLPPPPTSLLKDEKFQAKWRFVIE